MAFFPSQIVANRCHAVLYVVVYDIYDVGFSKIMPDMKFKSKNENFYNWGTRVKPTNFMVFHFQ